MVEWGYWRLQVLRNLPIAMTVAFIVASFGWLGLRYIPIEHTAAARLVLERQVGLTGSPKAQRTSEEVQHIQSVIHALTAEIGGSDSVETYTLDVQTSRDKPTYLYVTATKPAAQKSVALVQTLSKRGVEISDTLQAKQIAAALSRLQDRLNDSQIKLSRAQDALATHRSNAPTWQLDTLREQAALARAALRTHETKTAQESPALTKLTADLAAARSLYSDIHPKVRLIRARIEQAQRTAATNAPLPTPAQPMVQRLLDLDAQIAGQVQYAAVTRQLEQAFDAASFASTVAHDALSTAQSKHLANRIRLKVVEDANLIGRGEDSMRDILHGVILLAALAAAGVVLVLRIKFDARLRRPSDLHRTLGLVPFATLPDLGPSLS